MCVFSIYNMLHENFPELHGLPIIDFHIWTELIAYSLVDKYYLKSHCSRSMCVFINYRSSSFRKCRQNTKNIFSTYKNTILLLSLACNNMYVHIICRQVCVLLSFIFFQYLFIALTNAINK